MPHVRRVLLVKILMCIFVVICFFPGLLGAIDVAVEEIRTYDGTTIEYTSYAGPHDFVNTADEIRTIGIDLDLLRRQTGESGIIRGKYELRRIPPPAEGSSYGADILVFERGALVDHIDNVRRIITGYLMQAFGYTAQEADSLAEAITLYNTYLRNRTDYVASRYSTAVVSSLRTESLGLSRFYYDWPGSTSIVIPLVSSIAHPREPAPADTPGTTRPAEEPLATPRVETPSPADTRSPAAVPPSVAAERSPEVEIDTPTTPSERPSPVERPLPPRVPGEEVRPVAPPAISETPGAPAATPPPLRAPADSVASEERQPEAEPPDEVPEPRPAVEEIMTPPDELTDPKPDAVIRETRERARFSNAKLTYGIGGGLLFLLLLIAAIVFLRRTKESRSQNRSYLPLKSKKPAFPGRRIGEASENTVVMRLIFRDYLLNRKHYGDLQPGKIRSVGGKGAYFAIPYIQLPGKIAEVENRGDVVVFNPVRPEYFPDLRGSTKDFYEKEIVVRAKTGEQVVIIFHKYVSPLEEVNRIMRSIRQEDPADNES